MQDCHGNDEYAALVQRTQAQIAEGRKLVSESRQQWTIMCAKAVPEVVRQSLDKPEKLIPLLLSLPKEQVIAAVFYLGYDLGGAYRPLLQNLLGMRALEVSVRAAIVTSLGAIFAQSNDQEGAPTPMFLNGFYRN